MMCCATRGRKDATRNSSFEHCNEIESLISKPPNALPEPHRASVSKSKYSHCSCASSNAFLIICAFFSDRGTNASGYAFGTLTNPSVYVASSSFMSGIIAFPANEYHSF
ncbi:cytochrome p450, partial [Moniliophthora roreri]